MEGLGYLETQEKGRKKEKRTKSKSKKTRRRRTPIMAEPPPTEKDAAQIG